ncbi:MAG: glutamine synthetase family protein [Acidimicrobiia bacterium]|nr:glutamine synthetase family protein [Acidimicrobiia bacterium]MDH5421153.1 glutamine synthetase family protein [Acidimicrobiia bacterium]MDH5503067.1 glutamine synthetase family protein [Acidimicrobiia bacterium]
MTTDKQAEYVLQTVAKRGIRFIRLWFTDVQGFMKSVAISPAELETALTEGMTFDGSSIDGYARVHEADMIARPDPKTFQILPWREPDGVARIFCDIHHTDGTAFAGDPRNVLRRNLRGAADLGYSFYVAPELEFFYFADSGPNPKVLDQGGYFDLTPLDTAQEYRRTTIEHLEKLGIPVEQSHHEVAPSQHEITLRYDDAMAMADNVMTYRLTVKEVALAHGIYATFMPKPLEDHDGSGFHTHMSLFEGGENAFYSADTEHGLSKTADAFIAGLVHHAPAMTAITNQWVNSYKRLVAGFEAPIYAFWARNNQSALVRVPTTKAGKSSSTRIEYRSPDAATNPYLTFSVLLAAGLDGVRNAMSLPEEVGKNVFEMSSRERRDHGIRRLPETLSHALDELEQSELMNQALGDHVFDWFLRNKRKEWDAYQHHVSRFELERYLPIL